MKKFLVMLMIAVMLLTSVAAAIPTAAAVYNQPEIEALVESVDAANEIVNGTTVYMPEAWNVFLEALAEAEALLKSEGLRDSAPEVVEAVADRLDMAMAILDDNKGADIYTASEFKRLAGQDGIFYLKADITVDAPIAGFTGVLVGGGHTITLKNNALFTDLSGEITTLKVVGKSGNASSLFGKAIGEVSLMGILVDVDGFATAALFDEIAEDAEVEISAAVVKADTDALVKGEAYMHLCYLQGVEYYLNGAKKTDAEIAMGLAAINVNTAFGEIILVQVLGEDKYPVIGAPAANGSNVVVMAYDAEGTPYLKNAADFIVEDGIEAPDFDTNISVAVSTEIIKIAISNAEALKAEAYTEGSWARMQAALANAKAILNNADATQEMIDLIASALIIETANLAVAPTELEKTEIDYTKLSEALTAAKALKRTEYTEASWANLKVALAMAEIAVNATSQGSVNAARISLEGAIRGLVKAEPVVETQPATETEPAAEESGCGSVIGGAAVALVAVAAIGACAVLKKKED